MCADVTGPVCLHVSNRCTSIRHSNGAYDTAQLLNGVRTYTLATGNPSFSGTYHDENRSRNRFGPHTAVPVRVSVALASIVSELIRRPLLYSPTRSFRKLQRDSVSLTLIAAFEIHWLCFFLCPRHDLPGSRWRKCPCTVTNVVFTGKLVGSLLFFRYDHLSLTVYRASDLEPYSVDDFNCSEEI